MSVRFIHTSDWQLGKPFGRFDPDLSGRLRSQRQETLVRIAQIAQKQAVQHILVAGDIWDHAAPNNATLRQPLDILGEYSELTWWLLPGNHDPDGPDRLWDRVAAMASENVRLLKTAEPIEMEAGVWILPAPWKRLHHGQDLTDWMDAAETPQGDIRIGIAHGSIKTFGTQQDGREDGETDAIIPPDRAAWARLDYLALGDWHARTDINSRTCYCGTPEPDRFKTGERGQVLLVEIEASGETPTVTSLPTAQFDWISLHLDLRIGQMNETLETIKTRVQSGLSARQTLAQITVSGETTVEEWQRFETEIDTLEDRCAFLELRGTSSVSLKIVADDLDALDAQGSVRQAAETLDLRRNDPSLSEDDREVAAEALRLLFSFSATQTDQSGLSS